MFIELPILFVIMSVFFVFGYIIAGILISGKIADYESQLSYYIQLFLRAESNEESSRSVLATDSDEKE